MTAPDRWQVRAVTRRAVLELVKRSGGTTVSRLRVRSDPGAGSTDEPEPLAGIRAARAVEQEARRLCRDECIRYAREDGLTWTAIGEALGYRDDPPDDPRADRAFRYAVPAYDSGDWFTWTCPSCAALVRDHGPYGSPAETEEGHAGGCQRLAAAMEAWEAQWDEDDDDPAPPA
jgi:hypothetical protein